MRAQRLTRISRSMLEALKAISAGNRAAALAMLVLGLAGVVGVAFTVSGSHHRRPVGRLTGAVRGRGKIRPTVSRIVREQIQRSGRSTSIG